MAKILIIDDDALIRAMSSKMLKNEGHEIITANNPTEGYKALNNNGDSIDLILLDIVMPEESGLTMLPKIQTITPKVPIIIITAVASLDSAIQAIKLGAYDYLRKPLVEGDIKHSINKALEFLKLTKYNDSLLEKYQQRIEDMQLCKDISIEISQTLDLNKLLAKVMKICTTTFCAESCSILLRDKKTEELYFSAVSGPHSKTIQGVRLKSGAGISGWVLSRGTPVIINDVYTDQRFYKKIDKLTGFETKNIMASPLIIHGRGIGVIEIINKIGTSIFTNRDLNILVTIASQLATAMDNANLTESLKESSKKIADYNNNLERMVEGRTIELKKANYKLKSAQEQVIQSEKLSSIGQLSAGVAHEINNPIGFINSNLKTLSEYAETTLKLIEGYSSLKQDNSSIEAIKSEYDYNFIKKDMPQLIKESIEGASRVIEIVKDLKGFARTDNKATAKVNLHTCINSTLNMVANEIKYKAQVKKDFGEIPEIECRPVQINQVIMNLLVNAAQAIKDEGLITIKTYSLGENIILEISDTGEGIKKDIMEKIFDPLFTTKEASIGTGLGLSVTYSIVKSHSGDIEAISTTGKGTTFKVTLPAKLKST